MAYWNRQKLKGGSLKINALARKYLLLEFKTLCLLKACGVSFKTRPT